MANGGNVGAPSPLEQGEGQCLRGRNRTYAPAGLLGVEAVAPRKGSMSQSGEGLSPAKTRPHGKGSAYNRKTGSRREGSRLAAEAVRAMTARTTQPRLSKGPLGERGRCLQERLGVVPLAAITRRGAVPVWLRASWSGPLAAAKAASQPANCRRHEGWSRSPSPCTRWGTRLLICARFQPDWGKPNVRLIGGWEETGASRLCRAARGASRLPDHSR